MRRRALLAAPALIALPTRAQTPTPVRFSLDWALQGNHAIWSLAEDLGHFRQAGLAVRMDRGFGSGDTVVKVGAGAYDLGFADISSAVKFNAENPDRRVVAVCQVFERTLASVVTLRRSGIARPTDLAGRRLGAPEGEGSRLLFPAYARAAGIETARIAWTAMAPNLREAMLHAGQVDAITGFVSTSFFNLVGVGQREEDIVVFPYADVLPLYGSAVIVRADWAARNAATVRGFVAATIAGTRALLADADAGMASLKRREALLDVPLEKRRWQLVRDRAVLTETARRTGFGTMEEARMALVVQANAEAYGIAAPPPAAAMFDASFLPPAAERAL